MPFITRYINALGSGFSFLVSSMVHRSIVSGMPSAIGVELTNRCNLRCPECPTGSGTLKREKGNMDPVLLDKLVKELGPYLLNMNLFFQGEPMLHPAFFELLELCRTVHTTVSTNGHFLTRENCLKIAESGLGKLIISLDGIDQATYSSYRINGDVEKVAEGIGNIAEAKRSSSSALKVVIQFLVNKLNENQVSEVKRLANEADLTLSLKSMQINKAENIEKWLPSGRKFRRYGYSGGTYSIMNSLPRRCARIWLNPVITWDGRVVPCCFDKDAEFVMGDFNTQSFREIWHGKKFTDFRKEVLSGREKILICRNCTSGLTGINT